jgi:cytochrome c-type biogenesis protein CcmH
MSTSTSSNAGTKAQILTLRQQLQQLKLLRESGSLSQTAYEQAATPLERQLVDLVLAHPDAAAAAASSNPVVDAAAAAPARPSKALVGSLLAGVLVLAAAGYAWTGSPGATRMAETTAPQQGAADAASADEQQFAAAVEKLAQRLKDQPDNAEGWAMLARSYARLGKHAEAVPAYVKAVALRGDDARLLADYADTLAVNNGRSLAGEPLNLVLRALKLDPQNPKALALAGTAAFDSRDFKAAVGYWETLASVLPADSDFVPQLQGSIEQARELAGMPKGQPLQRAAPALAPPVAGAAPAAPPAPATAQAASAGKLQGTVRLAPKLAAQAAPTDTVFIYARAAEGPRMPLAILRMQVKDLPLNFTLDDSSAMSPAMRLSLHPKVVVSARVSKSGQAAPGPGDMTGQSAPLDNTASGVVIEISDVLK